MTSKEYENAAAVLTQDPAGVIREIWAQARAEAYLNVKAELNQLRSERNVLKVLLEREEEITSFEDGDGGTRPTIAIDEDILGRHESEMGE